MEGLVVFGGSLYNNNNNNNNNSKEEEEEEEEEDYRNKTPIFNKTIQYTIF